MYKRGFVIFGVVSLTMGNSRLPFRYGLVADAQRVGQLSLGEMLFLPQAADRAAGHIMIHVRFFLSLRSRWNEHTPSGRACLPALRRVRAASIGTSNF